MKKRIFGILLFLSAASCPAAAGSFSALLEEAEKSFAEGNYGKTIEIYEALAEVEKVNDAGLYYNLSNAYYRNGDTGKAVVNIEKAYLLNPMDKDIRHNRNFLAKKAGAGRESAFNGFYENFLNILPLNRMTVITAFLAFLPLLFLALFLPNGKKVFKMAAVFSAALFVFFAFVTAVKVKKEITDITAVTLKEAAVRSGPGENNPELFKLAPGRKIRAERFNNGWTFVSVKPENFSGWIENGSIEKING